MFRGYCDPCFGDASLLLAENYRENVTWGVAGRKVNYALSKLASGNYKVDVQKVRDACVKFDIEPSRFLDCKSVDIVYDKELRNVLYALVQDRVYRYLIDTWAVSGKVSKGVSLVFIAPVSGTG